MQQTHTVVAHALGGTGDLIDGLAFHGQCSQISAHLYRRRFSAHDLIHDLQRCLITHIFFFRQF